MFALESWRPVLELGNFSWKKYAVLKFEKFNFYFNY
jgi:hypothetical protein